MIEADICRDGGSLVADFERDDGSRLSILLEVVLRHMESGEARHFGHLHVGTDIQNSCDPRTMVAKGSPAEVELLNDLDAWSNDMAGRVPAGKERSYLYVLELRSALENREG
ncbi:MAG: hypothetical protein ABIS51_02735 [Sphingomonas sp.]